MVCFIYHVFPYLSLLKKKIKKNRPSFDDIWPFKFNHEPFDYNSTMMRGINYIFFFLIPKRLSENSVKKTAFAVISSDLQAVSSSSTLVDGDHSIIL